MIIKITSVITLEKHELDDLLATIRSFVETNKYVTRIDLSELTEEQHSMWQPVLGHERVGMIVRAEGHSGPGVNAIVELLAKMGAYASKGTGT